MTDTGRWEPVATWVTEQPQRCTTCGDVLEGRELGYVPNMCERDGCPGPGERFSVMVSPTGERPS